MSYIDTFDHEFVGYFGGLPVYHPLEVVPPTPDCEEDFGCGPEHLVIGGGSGEHPGIVVTAPGATVVVFVRAWLDVGNPDLSPEARQALQPAIEAWPDADIPGTRLHARLREWRQLFEFAGWGAADYVAFGARCTSRAFHRPFDPEQDASLEHWLAASVGEFILLAMPELAQDAVQRLGDLRRHVSGGLYQNILLLPPGYPTWGRKVVDNQLTWGKSAWRVQREH